LVVDEPETHFHSLLAVRLWNALEDARPDVRFVYVTHDLTFALSRRHAQYVIASPIAGLRTIRMDEELPADVAEALLGSASLSFYASRIIFCEGDHTSLDGRLYSAWFNGADTVVRPVNDSQSVLRCVDALRKSGMTRSLDVLGIVDRDFRSDEFIASLGMVHVLPVHEIESLLSWPAVVEAIARHMGREFKEESYLKDLRDTVTAKQRSSIVIERWKVRVEPNLIGLVASSSKGNDSLDSMAAAIPGIFQMSNWSFSPEQILAEEKARVGNGIDSEDAAAFFALVPGKQLLQIAAKQVGMDRSSYASLIIRALGEVKGGPLQPLRESLTGALAPLLPPRAVAAAVPGGLEA
jgi:hypothetical protein